MASSPSAKTQRPRPPEWHRNTEQVRAFGKIFVPPRRYPNRIREVGLKRLGAQIAVSSG
jgi:hypothetical protein